MKLTHKWQLYHHFWPFIAISMVIFHKTEIQTVILRCITGLNCNWVKSYETKHKYFCFWIFAILYKNTRFRFCVFCIFVFCVITFVKINRYAPQNDRLNLSFVKDERVVGKKMTVYDLKMAIYHVAFFFLEFAELACSLRLHLRP